MQTYKLELTFDQINVMICHGIWPGKNKMEKIINLKMELNEVDVAERFNETLGQLNDVQKEIEQQMWDQGNTTIGFNHKYFDVVNAEND